MRNIYRLWLSLAAVAVVAPASVGRAQDLANLGKQKPFTLSGTLDLRSIVYTYSGGITPRRRPNANILNANATLSIYGVAIPLSVVLSDQERSVRQPFNQFGLSPTYKWLTLHLGYRNLTWSPFTLAGHTIYGAGAEVTTKKLRLGFIKGRFNRATTVDQSLGTVVPFGFDRSGYAARVGVGNDTTSFDVSLVVARDDSSSVPLTERRTAGYVGSLVRPAENAVLGFNTRVGLGHRRYFFFTAAGGLSVYTREPNSRLTLGEGAGVRYLNTFVGPLIAVNGSSEVSTAWQAALAFRRNGQGFQLSYQRISPGYQSMGAYYFQSDVSNLTLAPSLSLLKGKVRVGGSFGLQQDNLRNQKQLTSRRFIASLNGTVELGPYFGVDASYSNFSTDQQQAKAVVVRDTFRLAQSTQSLSVGPRFAYTGTHYGHTVLLSVDRSTLRALGNNVYDRGDEFTSLNAFASYQLTVLAARLTLGATCSYTQLQLATGTDENRGLQFSADQSLGKQQVFRLGLRASALMAQRFGQPSTVRLGGARATLRLGRHNALRADIAYTSYDPTTVTLTTPRYAETRGEFGYTFSF